MFAWTALVTRCWFLGMIQQILSAAIVVGCCSIVPTRAMCVRPIQNHWMDDESVSNISVNLFRIADGPELEEVFLSFAHSGCFAPFAGEHRFVCDGRSINVRCARGHGHNKHSWELGIGKSSVVWSRFYQMELTQNHAVMHTRDSNSLHSNDSLGGDYEYCDRTRNANQTLLSLSLCRKRSSVYWTGHGTPTPGERRDITFEMFSDSSDIVLPPDIYADMQQHVASGNKHHLEFTFDWGDWRLRCGENCLWSERFMSPFEFHAKLGSVDQLVLNERFLQNHFLDYHSDAHALKLTPYPFAMRSPGWKLFSQLFLIFKLTTAVWVGTRHFNKAYSSYLGWSFMFVIFLETVLIQYDALTLAEICDASSTHLSLQTNYSVYISVGV